MQESLVSRKTLRSIHRKSASKPELTSSQTTQERSVWAKSKWRKPVVISVGGWGRASRGN